MLSSDWSGLHDEPDLHTESVTTEQPAIAELQFLPNHRDWPFWVLKPEGPKLRHMLHNRAWAVILHGLVESTMRVSHGWQIGSQGLHLVAIPPSWQVHKFADTGLGGYAEPLWCKSLPRQSHLPWSLALWKVGSGELSRLQWIDKPSLTGQLQNLESESQGMWEVVCQPAWLHQSAISGMQLDAQGCKQNLQAVKCLGMDVSYAISDITLAKAASSHSGVESVCMLQHATCDLQGIYKWKGDLLGIPLFGSHITRENMYQQLSNQPNTSIQCTQFTLCLAQIPNMICFKYQNTRVVPRASPSSSAGCTRFFLSPMGCHL